MQKNLTQKRLLWILIIVGLLSFACQLPLGQNTDQGTANTDDLQATIVALQTQMAQPEDVQPTDTGLSGDTETHNPQVTATLPADTEQPDQVEQPGQADQGTSGYRGFMAHTNQHFVALDFNGVKLGFDAETSANPWIGENEVSVFNDQVYYAQFGENSGVFRVTQQGSQRLDFIDVGTDPASILVSPDGSMIAWGTSQWINNSPETSLYLANIDGSNQRLVAQIPSTEQVDLWRLYYPYRWTVDGKLVYATGLTGIGGYMLFWGYNGMFLYDPASNSSTTLVSEEEHLGICLSSISEDLQKIAITCGDSNQVRVRQLSNGAEVAYPLLPDQGMAGAARFSPSGEWLAYVIQRAEHDNELGKIVVAPTDGSFAPQVIAEVSNGSFVVEGWADENTVLVTRNEFKENSTDISIWRMNRDGTDAVQVTDGQFIGFIP